MRKKYVAFFKRLPGLRTYGLSDSLSEHIFDESFWNTTVCSENWKTRILTHLPLGPLDISIFLCRGFCHKIRHVFRPYVNCSNQCWISKGQSGSLVGRFIWLVFWPWPHTIREKERNSEWRNSFWEAGLCTCCGDTGACEDNLRLASWQSLK